MFSDIISNEDLEQKGKHEREINEILLLLKQFQMTFWEETILYSSTKGKANEDEFRNNYSLKLDQGLLTSTTLLQKLSEIKAGEPYLRDCKELINKLSEEK